LKWSYQEIEALKKLYPLYIKKEITREQLLKVFTFRSFNSIQQKAGENNLTGNNIGFINTKALKEILK